jgi:hypothetical protein
MKIDKSIVASFVLLVVIASLYRILPGRPLGFAPQIAMAIFSGSIVANKKYSFLLPLLSMLVSDIFYEVLFQSKLSVIPGFYGGQWINYLLFGAITVIGFAVNQRKWMSILAGSLAGVFAYFILSNGAVWIGGGMDINNHAYPKSFDGFMICLAAGLPFLKGSLYATLMFSGVLFGGYSLLNKYVLRSNFATL